jgi:menaquinone-dependent protoporphyrinogen IX oxidase
MSATRPLVLFVYYTYSQQTLRVVEAMANALRERGCDVRVAAIEFTDPRYADRFSRFPLRHPYRDIFGMLPPQLRGVTGQIRIPDELRKGDDYDLVCIASPTWWLHPCMPIRSFLESDLAGTLLARKRFAAIAVSHRYWRGNLRILKELGIKRGGEYLGGCHFIAGGGPIGSMLALFSYLSTGVIKQRYLGVKIPPADLQPSYVGQAQTFANELADRLGRQSSELGSPAHIRAI